MQHGGRCANDFYGVELGVSTSFGFDQYELNFGKYIPHFKKFNSMQPVYSPANRNYGLDQLWPVYAAINPARNFSPALHSPNRYFLVQTSGGAQPSIFSVTKYQTAGGSPNFNDVVFAFSPLDRSNELNSRFRQPDRVDWTTGRTTGDNQHMERIDLDAELAWRRSTARSNKPPWPVSHQHWRSITVHRDADQLANVLPHQAVV